MITLRYTLTDGFQQETIIKNSASELILKQDELPGKLRHVDILNDCFTADAGDEGYLVIPSVEGSHHAALTYFTERKDTETIYPESSMPIYGICHEGKATMALVTGMRFEYSLVMGVKNNRYYLYPRIILDGRKAYEDIVIRFVKLTDSGACWQGMARWYRNYQLQTGACKPLKERSRSNPVLDKLCEGIEVRIRLAWKPVPSTIEDQTLENEPPVHVELTFKQVQEIIREFHRQGISHANICLVGWNAGGHDGRFPDLLPLEPKCGTMEEFLEIFRLARSYGYLISCHTNLIEGYSIARRFDIADTLKLQDGTPMRGGNWGGGKSYFLCPKVAYEKFVAEDMKLMKKFGCYGAHYFDVFSIKPPHQCFDPQHPLNRKENAEWRCRLLQAAREAVGASASEGGWDFCAEALDYVLYPAYFFKEPPTKNYPLCDKVIPLWFMVYHGILLYNCFAAGMNAAIKHDKSIRLVSYAWGGRPVTYINSRYRKDTNVWGEEDLRYDSPEQFSRDLNVVKLDYDIYRTLQKLQFEAMVDYTEPSPGIMLTSYSNGTSTVVNNTGDEISMKNKGVSPYSISIISED